MSNTFTKLTSHLVWSTKKRIPMITPELKKELYKYIGGIVTNRFGDELLAIGGIENHIHILVCLPACYSVPEFVRIVKANSSRFVNVSKGLDYSFAWQRGYSGFAVSNSMIPKAKRYIANQEEHHKDREYEEELALLLKKNSIAYDANSLFE